jgi:hypothetical protein
MAPTKKGSSSAAPAKHPPRVTPGKTNDPPASKSTATPTPTSTADKTAPDGSTGAIDTPTPRLTPQFMQAHAVKLQELLDKQTEELEQAKFTIALQLNVIKGKDKTIASTREIINKRLQNPIDVDADIDPALKDPLLVQQLFTQDNNDAHNANNGTTVIGNNNTINGTVNNGNSNATTIGTGNIVTGNSNSASTTNRTSTSTSTTTGTTTSTNTTNGTTSSTGINLHTNEDEEDEDEPMEVLNVPPPLLLPRTLSKVIEPHSNPLQTQIQKFKKIMEVATTHLNIKQASKIKFSGPDYRIKSARMKFELHQHRDVSPLIQEDFSKLSEDVGPVLDRQQQELTVLVAKQLELMVKNLNYLRVQELLKHSSALLFMHLAGTICKTRSSSTLMETFEHTQYRLLKLLIRKLSDQLLRYLINEPKASATAITHYKNTVILRLFDLMYGAHKPTAGTLLSPEDSYLINEVVDTLLKYLPHATVLHSEKLAQQQLEAEVTAAELAAHSRALTTAATKATAEALATEDLPPDYRTIQELVKAEIRAETSWLVDSNREHTTALDTVFSTLSITDKTRSKQAKSKSKPHSKAKTKLIPKSTGKRSHDSTTATRSPKRQKKVTFEPQANRKPTTTASRGGRGNTRGRNNKNNNSSRGRANGRANNRNNNTSNKKPHHAAQKPTNTRGRGPTRAPSRGPNRGPSRGPDSGRGKSHHNTHNTHNNNPRGGRGHNRGGPNRGRGRNSNRR